MIIPISKAGMLAQYDEIELKGSASAYRIVRFAPAVEVAPIGGDLVLRVQNLSGIAPTFYLEATIVDGQRTCTPVTGLMAIAGGASFWIHVVSAPVASPPSWLIGYVEDSVEPTGAFLCSVPDVKLLLGLETSEPDVLLTAIVAGVSRRIQVFCGRSFIIRSRVDRLSVNRSDPYLILPDFPVYSVASVTVEGEVVDPADYLITSGGMLYNAGRWPKGSEHVVVDWISGELSIPADVARACCSQSAFEYRRAKAGGNLLGVLSKAHEGGGSTTYQPGAWLPEVLDVLVAHRRLV